MKKLLSLSIVLLFGNVYGMLQPPIKGFVGNARIPIYATETPSQTFETPSQYYSKNPQIQKVLSLCKKQNSGLMIINDRDNECIDKLKKIYPGKILKK